MPILVILFFTGVLFGASLCLVSCGPVLISYICGTHKSVSGSLAAYALFSVSRIAVYIVLSMCLFLIGQAALTAFIADYGRFLYILAGFFLMLIGVYFILGKRMELKPFNLIYRHIVKGDTKNVIVLGIAYGLLPCAPLLGVLSYIGLVSNGPLQNIGYAVSFGAGTFVSPLLLVSLAAGAVPRAVKDPNGLGARIVRVSSGLIALFMAVQLARRAFP